MSFQQVLLERRTIHDYREGSLPEGTLERALQAAIAAPNHRMTEPWRFVRVGPKTRKQLLNVAIALKSSPGATLPDAAKAKLAAKMLHPAELLVVCQAPEEKPEVAREDYAAIACAVQNLMLSLHSEGVGSKWSTGGVSRDPKTYELLGIRPDEGQIVGFIWIGFPASETAPKARRRKQLSDVLRQLP